MTPRNNLSDFIKERCIEAARAALGGGGDVEEAIAQAQGLVDDVLDSPEVRRRIKNARPQEKAKFAKDLPEFVRELHELGVAPPSLLIPQGPDKMNVEPATVKAMLHEAAAARAATFKALRHGEAAVGAATAAAVTSKADEALEESAGDADPPSQGDLAAWVGHCPHDVLTEVEERLAVMWRLKLKQVRVTGWFFGGLVTWRDGVEFHAPAAELVAESKRRKIPNPLAPLVRACPTPVDGKANLRPDRILSAKLAMVDPSHKRAGRLFSPAAHRRGQLVMPGFELADYEGPALPLALYQLGQDNPQRGGGRGAPLALRLFVEAVLAAPYDERNAGQPVALQVTLRDLLDRLYPGPRRPKPTEYWPRLMSAVEALDTMDARIPWHDPETGRGDLRRVVSVGGIPRGPGALDDVVRMVVDLPPGSGPGPKVSPTLGAWGAKSAPAYSAMLNLAYRWFDPGVTRHPVPGGHWLQVQDPKRYPALSDADVVAITRPLSARAARRKLAVEGWEVLRKLEVAGELRIEGRRVLPPAPEEGR